MKEFVAKLWNGEPAFVFGILNVGLVAALAAWDTAPQWFGILVVVVIAINAALVRQQVAKGVDSGAITGNGSE